MHPKVIPPPEPPSTPVGEEIANVESNSTPPAGIDFKPPKPSGSPAVVTLKELLRDNAAPTPTPSQNTESFTATEPKMSDTRIVNGQKQVYFLGFGWIEDNDTPNDGIYAADMYENGNMGGGEFVDGGGDIDKMVGTMQLNCIRFETHLLIPSRCVFYCSKALLAVEISRGIKFILNEGYKTILSLPTQ